MNPSGLFHQITGLSQAEKSSGSIREFLGDGTAYLRVPGLKEVKSVQIGRTGIPLEQDYQFPHNSNFQQKVQITFPFVSVQPGPDGVKVLLRSVHSNDGIWQAGQKIYVGGVWDDTPVTDDTPSVSTPTDDLEVQLATFNIKDLQAKAVELGINVPANTAKAQIINLIIDAVKKAQSSEISA